MIMIVNLIQIEQPHSTIAYQILILKIQTNSNLHNKMYLPSLIIETMTIKRSMCEHKEGFKFAHNSVQIDRTINIVHLMTV